MTSKDINSIFIIIGFGVLLAVPFLFYPDLDLIFSSLFYSKEQGFFLKDQMFVRGIYDIVPPITNLLIAGLFGSLFIFFLSPKFRNIPRRFVPRSWKIPVYLILVLALGPGAGIHWVSKEVFDRPRPREIVEFGGEKTYVAPFHIGTESGKSFVSGHASMGFYVAAFALLFSGRRRVAVYTSGIALGTLIGLGRIIQGGHFLSDIVYSGIFILFLAHALHAWMFQRDKTTT